MVNAYGYVTGGADYVCFELAEGLRERGHEVAFLSTESERNLVSEGVFVPLRVTHFTRGELPARAKAGVAANAIWNREAARGMEAAIERLRPEVVHAHKLYPQLSVAPLRVAARHGIPIVQSLYDYELLSASAIDHTGGRVDRDEQRRSYRVLNTATFPIRRRLHVPIVAVWTAGSRFLRDRYRAAGIEAEVLPWFVEAPGEGVPGFERRRGLTFVGRLAEEKGVRDVIALAEGDPELGVTVAGGGPLAGAVASAAARLPNLEFAGELPPDRVRDLVRGARISLMPSRWQEPGALAALEAMAAGTPVIAYANGGLAEYVGDSDGGEVVRPDWRELAAASRSLYDDRDEWERRSRAGLTAIRETHTRDRYVAGIEPLFERARSASA